MIAPLSLANTFKDSGRDPQQVSLLVYRSLIGANQVYRGSITTTYGLQEVGGLGVPSRGHSQSPSNILL